MMLVVYLTLSVIIAFGVVYNSARIQLSERARELATLRVLGFGRAEVSNVLLIEIGIIVAVAQPIGWLVSVGIGLVITAGSPATSFACRSSSSPTPSRFRASSSSPRRSSRR